MASPARRPVGRRSTRTGSVSPAAFRSGGGRSSATPRSGLSRVQLEASSAMSSANVQSALPLACSASGSGHSRLIAAIGLVPELDTCTRPPALVSPMRTGPPIACAVMSCARASCSVKATRPLTCDSGGTPSSLSWLALNAYSPATRVDGRSCSGSVSLRSRRPSPIASTPEANSPIERCSGLSCTKRRKSRVAPFAPPFTASTGSRRSAIVAVTWVSSTPYTRAPASLTVRPALRKCTPASMSASAGHPEAYSSARPLAAMSTVNRPALPSANGNAAGFPLSFTFTSLTGPPPIARATQSRAPGGTCSGRYCGKAGSATRVSAASRSMLPGPVAE